MSERRHPQVVNIDEVEAREEARGDFGYRTRRLGGSAGNRALGCSHFELPPGKTSFPFHFHSAIEESIYILDGTGAVRLGAQTIDVRAGDYVGFPPGPDAAHTLTNTGTTPLRYLAMSAPATPTTMDVCVYPDSNKTAFFAGVDPAKGWRGGAWAMKIVKTDAPPLDYYDGEPLAKK
jgi:uncharacterized cupin superfamily protein